MEVSQDVLCRMCESDPRFLKLYEEHQILEKQLEQLERYPFLTAEQEVERKKIQKMKLAGKDEMNQLLKAACNS